MDGIIFAVIVIISIIGWISNAISENKQKNQNAQRGDQQRPPKKRNLQGELESFLQELQGEKKKPQQKPTQPQRPQPQRQQKQSAKKQKRSTTRSGQQHRTSQQKPKEAVGTGHHSVFEDNAKHPVGAGNLGGGLKKHVEEYIESRHVGNSESDIAAKRSVREKSAYSRGGSKSVSSTTSSANRQAFELLQSTDGIRAAIILNEILQPPVSQRSDRF
ncbi:MAG: hypothetical protein JKY95_02340 [Planctomycetaceae bacterium]|nr:hypothetical protein [Planctomycetaceae bacterium]